MTVIESERSQTSCATGSWRIAKENGSAMIIGIAGANVSCGIRGDASVEAAVKGALSSVAASCMPLA